MASWSEIEAEAPELAARARRIFDRHIHKTMATVRRDGSPPISGTEANFKDGEIWIGSMSGAVKARDLQRDPRYALHSASEADMKGDGDAKIAGRADEVPSGGDFHRFRLDVTELVVTWVDGDDLVISSWHEGRGTAELRRK